MRKEIENYPGYYISDDGTVIGKRGKILNQSMRGFYYGVSLCNKDGVKMHSVHRLVAMAFVENPDDLPCVNHKDENKLNNNADNLEWCSSAYNNSYGNRGKKSSLTQLNRNDCSKAVIQYDLDGKFLAEYPSCKEAWRKTGVNRSHIGECCRHYKNQYTAGGYVWKWKSEVLL